MQVPPCQMIIMTTINVKSSSNAHHGLPRAERRLVKKYSVAELVLLVHKTSQSDRRKRER